MSDARGLQRDDRPRPALIARGVDVADVIAAVTSRASRTSTSRCAAAGTMAPGSGTVDDGLVIDLSPMRGVRVDPEARTAPVEGGAHLGDVDHATHAFGLATPSGIISTTGVGGLTLGGGIGHLSRKYGLAIDNLSPPTWCSPTAALSPPARTRTPTSSGRSAAAAATSASSPRSSSASTR